MRPEVNNRFYDTLGDDWYSTSAHPVAILRAEGRLKGAWVCSWLETHRRGRSLQVLDVGCGGGFLCNLLATHGHSPVGIDISGPSLEVARKNDLTHRAQYLVGDALDLPFPNQSFDVVCCMDMLEHTERPRVAVAEAARVLKPGGLFFTHTFDRNPLAGLMAIKLIEWLVPNTPKHFHVYHLFIRPAELLQWFSELGLVSLEVRGVRPIFFQPAMLKGIITRRVPEEFRFTLCDKTWIGYLGVAARC